MSQILHIFRKDVRHFWIEILASLVLLSAYTWKTIHGWGAQTIDVDEPAVLMRTISALVPISWCFLIVRAVLDESLVGDRQFWITRPYEWKNLLVAKLLFATAFVSLPLFVADVTLLARAGFSPAHYLTGLLWMQLMMFLALVLPAAAVSAISSNFVQVLLWILGIGLFLVGVAASDSVVPGSDVTVSSDFGGDASIAMFVGLGVAVLLLQYCRRQTQMSRSLLLGVAILVAVLVVAIPYTRLIERSYPLVAAGEVPPARLDMLVPISPSNNSVERPIRTKEVDLNFPFETSGIPAGYVVIEAGTLTTINSPNGHHWSSHWKSAYGEIWPGQSKSSATVTIPRDFFESVQSGPVDVHFSFALSLYREADSRKVITQAGEFSVPGVGTCWIDLQQVWDNSAIACHSPIQRPPLIVRMESRDSTCSPSGTGLPLPDVTKHSWNPSDDSPAAFGINPIQYLTISLSRWLDQGRRDPSPGICPGTPITLSTPDMVQSARVETELDNVRLQDYESQFTRF
ncbi:MAG TPA: hypothetical protein VMD78_10915 [Candidatus Baltobacteraceae bacterium]|nr:hypothetical protein [Candidatus Baltobacteraceae bacterium]